MRYYIGLPHVNNTNNINMIDNAKDHENILDIGMCKKCLGGYCQIKTAEHK